MILCSTFRTWRSGLAACHGRTSNLGSAALFRSGARARWLRKLFLSSRRCNRGRLRSQANATGHEQSGSWIVNSSKKTPKRGALRGAFRFGSGASPEIWQNYCATFCLSISICASVNFGWTRLARQKFASWPGTRILQPDRAMGLGIRLRMRCYRKCAFRCWRISNMPQSSNRRGAA